MPESPRLALPLLAAGQSQKDVTHNEAILALDRLVTLAAASRSTAAPPANPAPGECHIVPPAGATAWGQAPGTLMHWQGAGWLAEAPRDGQLALVMDEALLLVYLGSWRAHLPVAGLSIGGRSLLTAAPAAVAAPNGGGTVDSEARSAINALIAALQQQGILV